MFTHVALGVGVKMILKKELTEIISGNHPRPSAAITHLLEGQSMAISGNHAPARGAISGGNQWQSVAITHLLENMSVLLGALVTCIMQPVRVH